MNIRFGEEEANIFKILFKDNLNPESKLNKFGPFKDHHTWENNEISVILKIFPPRGPQLIGRAKKMSDIVKRIMSDKSKLITLLGLPGVGKSALINHTLHYI